MHTRDTIEVDIAQEAHERETGPVDDEVSRGVREEEWDCYPDGLLLARRWSGSMEWFCVRY